MTESEQIAAVGGEFFKTLFDQSPFAMLIYSPDGEIIKGNDACYALWEVSKPTAGLHYNIYEDEQAQRLGLTSAFNQALAGIGNSLRDVEYDPSLMGLAGRKRFIHVRMLPLGQENGQAEGVVCLLEDNTDNRLAEMERISYQERLEKEVDVRTKHLESLLQFSTELSGLGDLGAIYGFVTSWAKSLLQFDHSTLFVFSKENEELYMGETIGFPRSMVGSFCLLRDQGLPSLVAREQKVAVVEDFKTENRFDIPEAIFEYNLTSSLAVPMLNKNELVGVLIGHNRAKRIFSDSDISLYQNIANQAAVAIANTVNLSSLQRSEKRFRHLFENANDAIYLVDVETRRIVDCNRKALVLDGYSRSEIIAKKMFELYPQEERQQLDYRYEKVLRKGSFTTVSSFHHVSKDGSRIPVEISSSLVKTGGQKLIMNIVRDVSKRKALEEEQEATAIKLRRSSRMEAIGLMAGGVAHDLNNILSGVISYPEFMMLNLPEDSPVRADLQKIMESGRRAASVVADLLTVARGAATVKEAACINELIRSYMLSPEFYKLASLHPDVHFVRLLDTDVKTICCSSVHVQKILMNLVTNAAEAIDGAGKVEISTSARLVTEQETGRDGIPVGEYTVLRVRDSGSGITQHDLEHIFDPFYTTKKMGRSGTGLGLAVVWNTVLDHNGFITVNSDDQGTVFTLYMPVSSKGQAASSSKKEHPSLAGLHGKGTVLVADDEQVQQDIAVKILSLLGYEVTAVGSGEEAISFLEKNSVDLLLLDMLMEPGLSGKETFKKIIRFRPDQKALVVSGYSESDDINEVVKLGVHGLLKKPYTIEEMGRTVQEALRDNS
jgi:PAS domain S-box-containing protein